MKTRVFALIFGLLLISYLLLLLCDPHYALASVHSYAWHTFYGSTNTDYGQGIAADRSGNVYLVGRAFGTWNGPAGEAPLRPFSGTGSEDIVVVKLNSSGQYQWHAFYGSSSTDYGIGIAVDGSGNVYITGTSVMTWNGPAGEAPLRPFSGTGSEDIVVVKLNSSGQYQWHAFYGSGYADWPGGIAVDGNGNVYVMGESDATWNGPDGQTPLHSFSSGSSNFMVLQLSSSGQYQWHTFHGSAHDAGSIAVDGKGSVYATGASEQTWSGPDGQPPLHPYSAPSDDLVVLKLDSSGQYQWHTFYGPDNAGVGEHIAVDGSGNVYATGTSQQTWNGPDGQPPLHSYTSSYDIVVLKLNSSGQYQWHTFYDAPYGCGIAVDETGNAYVTGPSGAWNGPSGQPPLHPSSGGYDIMVLKLNSTGQYQWHTFYGPVSLYTDAGIALDGSKNVLVTAGSDVTWNGPSGQPPLHAFSGGVDIFVLELSDAPISSDFNGDGETDIAVYRSSTGAWYVIPSGGKTPYGLGWGGDPSDKPVPGDYGGDGKTDYAVYRTSTGGWYIYPSGGGVPYGVGWGGDSSDKPIPGDYDGDGKTDIAVYRSSTGAWYVKPSGGAPAYGVDWGGDSSDKPVPGDYDGDGKTDVAVYRTSTGTWYVKPSSGASPYGVGWGGNPTDKPVPGDYDGDGKTDYAVYRTSTGAWYVKPSSGGSPYGVGWGGNVSDKPVPGDYDGDGKTDIAVYRANTGAWYVKPSGSGTPYGVGWGGDPTDLPVITNSGSYM